MGYDFSSPNIVSSSTTTFVSPANNVNSENNELKTEIASENLDKGKYILGAPPKVEKKETRNSRTKRDNDKSFNKRSRTSVITMEIQGILVLIATSG